LKAKVRGIYATALTRLLLENGFEVVQPSQAIKSRFGIADNNEPPDLKVKDKHDLQGGCGAWQKGGRTSIQSNPSSHP